MQLRLDMKLIIWIEGWEKLFVHEWKVLTSIEDVNFSYDREYFAR
jgi:hypothetical protein